MISLFRNAKINERAQEEEMIIFEAFVATVFLLYVFRKKLLVTYRPF